VVAPAPGGVLDASDDVGRAANVMLNPGQSRFVLFGLTPNDLASYDTSLGKFTVARGRYAVLVGTSSTALDNRAGFDVGHFGHDR
jgi:fibronectin type III domain protein